MGTSFRGTIYECDGRQVPMVLYLSVISAGLVLYKAMDSRLSFPSIHHNHDLHAPLNTDSVSPLKPFHSAP